MIEMIKCSNSWLPDCTSSKHEKVSRMAL